MFTMSAKSPMPRGLHRLSCTKTFIKFKFKIISLCPFIFEVIFIFYVIFTFDVVFIFAVVFIFEAIFKFEVVFLFEVNSIFFVIFIFEVVFIFEAVISVITDPTLNKFKNRFLGMPFSGR